MTTIKQHHLQNVTSAFAPPFPHKYLLIVIIGAVTVLIFAPKGGPKPEPAKEKPADKNKTEEEAKA